jgi:integrase
MIPYGVKMLMKPIGSRRGFPNNCIMNRRAFFARGLRADALWSLRPEQINRRERQATLHIHGKGELDRFLPLPPALLRRLERYMRVDRPRGTRTEEAFVSVRRGRSGDYERLTPSGLLQGVTAAADRAGVEKRVIHTCCATASSRMHSAPG